MEQEPKYKVGQEVCFKRKRDKENVYCGTITQITPVNYHFFYTIIEEHAEGQKERINKKIPENNIINNKEEQ